MQRNGEMKTTFDISYRFVDPGIIAPVLFRNIGKGIYQ